MKINIIYSKSCLSMHEVDDESIDCCMTSPPYYGLRKYLDEANQIWGGDPECEHDFKYYNRPPGGGHSNPNKAQVGATKKDIQRAFGVTPGFCSKCEAWQGQLGLEPDFNLYLNHILMITAEIKRVLKKTGSLWLNMGDTYSGSGKGYGSIDPKYPSARDTRNMIMPHRFKISLPAKCLLGIPWRFVLRLIDEQGWILRNCVNWNKPNAMPSSVKDRLANKYEFLFHLVKQQKYYYDLDAIREPHKDIQDYQRHAPFNYRVGEAKKGHNGIIGVKSTEEEMQSYDRKGIRVPGQNPQGIHRKRHSGYYGANGECLVNPQGKNPGDCWAINTQPFPEAHFATFPEKLCERPILATCPLEICKKCGKARMRISKTNYKVLDKKPKINQPKMNKTSAGARFKYAVAIAQNQTIGWTDCGCNAGWRPGILLDLFAGAGTALVVTKKLGRSYIGYECVSDYVKMSEKRLAKTVYQMELF